jgi:hypothetical protein
VAALWAVASEVGDVDEVPRLVLGVYLEVSALVVEVVVLLVAEFLFFRL